MLGRRDWRLGPCMLQVLENGQQVDHLLEEFPPSEPIAPELQEQFQFVVNQFEEARNSLAPNASPVSLDVELSPR